jgi:Fungal Zn(2)-Cys(6) binuclear cluster domain
MDLLHMSMSDALAHSQKGDLLKDVSHRTEEQTAASGPTDPTISSQSRLVKKRASKACHHCRAKKIKCSLVKSGSPCNTCQLDDVECVVSKSRRNTAPRVAHASSSQSAHKELNISQEESAPIDPPNSAGSIPPFNRSFSISESPSSASSTVHTQALPNIATSHHSHNPASTMYQLPPYIRPPHSDMLADDLVLLVERGIFNLPEVALRNELLRAYSNYVHPLLPILDLRHVSIAIISVETDSHLSLMLFYAIMACGTTFADSHALESAGYFDRKAARKAIFQKAKVRVLSAYPAKKLIHVAFI